mmetsp:Transcript_2613/g.4451  ORF Transcript_2613/g.4451 Transcript_2613/m.4451 type:complete len:284 (+) Transcript_2613:174-1025(+)|eukprot:CAMPEP_0119105548 /NCGR_PEP_ID=MMETSP1180-20130426/3470_1 /TAXON_ID=3052 ORGANISM="Chlamydomonas cf sp, Strain CCMP681" /NCGR_SAMPLE_ID=MMETSP1180 /ASSEMBLY_ACC=CAM_ASM_000741 /LENGTH=283 /DNA_ID=CAMNT_0007090613 /DNA_START=174 /DNA_END=1025 /DNA_ORIENTATION=-
MAAKAAMDEAVLAAIRRDPNGLSDAALAHELPDMPPAERGNIINRLSRAGRIKLFKSGPDGKAIHYKEVSADDAVKFKGLQPEEVMLYQAVKASGSTGLWTKDMRLKTNLPQPHITKILRTLEGRNLVKSVKSVNNPSRKVYMLAELEPSREITGGAWYTEHQFDTAFIDVLREACLSFINRKGDTTLREIAAFIAAKKFAKVELRDEDINCIVQTLIYDGVVDAVDDEVSDVEHYRPMLHAAPSTTAFTSIPCGLCPIISHCYDDGLISPARCEYYAKWLSF